MISKGAIALSVVLALVAVAIGRPQAPAEEARYLSPGEMALSPDGNFLYVVCEGRDELRVLDTRSGTVVKHVSVGHVPRGLAVSPDGRRIYVTNSWTDNVSVIDAASLAVVGTLVAGFEPVGAVTDASGKTLYVANRISNDISVIDLERGKETKRLVAAHGASYLARSPDGARIYCTHVYPIIGAPGAFRRPPESEVTVIDAVRQTVIERKPLHNVAGVFHIAFSPDGKLGVVSQLRPKNLIPLAHVEHGWAFGNSLAVFGDGLDSVMQVPIDELERYYAYPFTPAVTPDQSKIFVTTAGSNSVTVIDVARLLKFIRSHKKPFANDLSASGNYVSSRIPVGRNPRGAVLSADGKRLYVANRMDDTVSVIDTTGDRVVSTIDLGGPVNVTPSRRGERIFYSAAYSFQGQFGCANCHIDATFDGLSWDLEPDGFGKDIVDNRLIEDLSGTEPLKWNGGNPNLATECGPRTEKFFWRSQNYNDAELADLVTFVLAFPSRPNRWRQPDGELTPAQERGKAIFERTLTKDRKVIPETNQCAYCHSGPKGTNRQMFDVGSGKVVDRSPVFDVPHLTNTALTAPYLHDGSARSLEEIWTVFNPKDTHGVTNDLTKDELNDLIEYLRTL